MPTQPDPAADTWLTRAVARRAREISNGDDAVSTGATFNSSI